MALGELQYDYSILFLGRYIPLFKIVSFMFNSLNTLVALDSFYRQS